MTLFIPRESIEFIPVTPTVDGVAVTENVTLSIVAAGARPSGWAAPTTMADGTIGYLVNGLTQGVWVIWAKITSSPEVPVIECGRFTVT